MSKNYFQTCWNVLDEPAGVEAQDKSVFSVLLWIQLQQHSNTHLPLTVGWFQVVHVICSSEASGSTSADTQALCSNLDWKRHLGEVAQGSGKTRFFSHFCHKGSNKKQLDYKGIVRGPAPDAVNCLFLTICSDEDTDYNSKITTAKVNKHKAESIKSNLHL